MNKANIVPIVGISALILCTSLSAVRDRQKVTEVEITPLHTEARTLTVDDAEANLRRLLDQVIPGSYRTTLDRDARTLTVDQWDPALTEDSLNRALTDIDYLRMWQKLLAQAAESCASAREYLDMAGGGDYALVWRFVSNADYSTVYAQIIDGEIVYDVVDATPPGERIQRSLQAPGEEQNRAFVLNTASKTFHVPGCTWAARISDQNKREVIGPRSELIAEGYSPCGICNP